MWKPGRQDFINMVSVVWDRKARRCVERSLFAAEITSDEDIAFGHLFDYNNAPDERSFYDETLCWS